jgi:glycosyltransferase involved in cell wall biosynthesis
VRVTIGLPYYGCQRTLARAIQSVFAQTYEDWELILVDDGSRDDSRGIARAVRDPRVRRIEDGRNRGLIHRLNEIASHARGEYLARMDGDDVMHPERIARQVAFLDAHSEVDVVGTAVFALDADERLTGVRGLVPRDEDEETILRDCPLAHPTVMGRTAWFRAHPYSPDFPRAEDHELWVRSWPDSVLARLAEPLLFYREVGTFKLASYLATQQSERRIIWQYGPARVGWARTLALLARTGAKSLLHRLASGLGAADRLVGRRSDPLTEALRSTGQAALERVRATVVPGLAGAA